MPRDYYIVLEVARNATEAEINQSYRRLALKLHPDRNAGEDTTAAFQILGSAYETLKDPIKRLNYDLAHKPNPIQAQRYTSPQHASPWPYWPPSSNPSQPTCSNPPYPPSSQPSHIPYKTEDIYFKLLALESSKRARSFQFYHHFSHHTVTIKTLRPQILKLRSEIAHLNIIDMREARAAERVATFATGASHRWILYPITLNLTSQLSIEEQARKTLEKIERGRIRIEKEVEITRCEDAIGEAEYARNVLYKEFCEGDLRDERQSSELRKLYHTMKSYDDAAFYERDKRERERESPPWNEARESGSGFGYGCGLEGEGYVHMNVDLNEKVDVSAKLGEAQWQRPPNPARPKMESRWARMDELGERLERQEAAEKKARDETEKMSRENVESVSTN